MLQALQSGQEKAATGTALFQLGVAGEGHIPKVQAYKGSLHMIARTLWSFRCKEWLLCCTTRHGRLICASVHRHAVQNLFELSQARRLHARLNGIAVQAT